MKKVLLAVLLFASVFTLAGCKQTEEETPVYVTFYVSKNSDSPVPQLRDLEVGQKIEKPEDPTLIGYVFNGWYKDYQATDAWDFNTDTVGKDSFVLYAGWVPDWNTIIYDLAGGEMITQDYLQGYYSGDFGVLPQSKLTGFKFVAWYPYEWLSPEGEIQTIPGDPGFQVIPDNMFGEYTLYAHYEALSLAVRFKANYPGEDGPSNPVSQTVDYGSDIAFEVLTDPTGQYTFLGWNTRKDGAGTFYVNGDPFLKTTSTTVYGAWELND